MTRILLLDDHALIVEGLRQVLLESGEAYTLTTASTAECALSILGEDATFDLVLVDLQLPDMHGIEAMRAIKRLYPALAIVVLSGSDNYSDMRNSLRSGASGYIVKSTCLRVMMQAIRLVLGGGTYVPPELILAESNITSTVSSVPAVGEKGEILLTARQREVLTHLATGKSNKEIARELFVSEATVKAHVTALLRAMAVENRAEAVSSAFRRGWVKGE